MNRLQLTLLLLLCWAVSPAQSNILVFQSDFGLKDGAVAAMKGVAMGVSPDLKILDLTHEIPAFNIWEASYRLRQTISYWPAGTVFVSIVDPGVGSSRKSVVAKTKQGPYYIVSPDNGTLTLVADVFGIEEVREIDEKVNRLPGSSESYTFHGRDVYAYTGARLAAGKISFSEVGAKLPSKVESLPFQPAVFDGKTIRGTVDVLDVQYGNVWTNIPSTLLAKAGLKYGDPVRVVIYLEKQKRYEGVMIFGKTFSDVSEGQPIAYLNSLMNFSVGLNMDDFASRHTVASGPEWSIELQKVK